MTENDFVEGELNFPLDCYFKVIAEKHPEILERIQETLMSLNMKAPVQKGRESVKGKYITYNITLRVNSKEQMVQIDNALREIRGVKMVL